MSHARRYAMDMDIEDSPVGQANGKKRRVRKGEGEGGGDDQNAEGENPDQEPSVVVRPPPRKRRRVAECKRHFIPNAGDRYMLVVIRRGEHEDVRISQRYKAWASTRDHTVTFSNAYKEASQHGGRLALFFTVYTEHPRDRALYGMAVMRSLPRPGTAGKVRWKSKYHWGDLFDVEWYYQDSAPPSGSLNMGCWTAPDSSSISLAYAKAMLASMERWTGEMIAEDPMDSMYDDPIEAFKKMRAARPTIELEEEDEEENDAGGRPGGEGAVPIEEQPDTSVKIPEEWAAPRPLSDDYFDPDKADLNFCMYDIDQSTMPSIDTAENGKPAFDRIRSPEVPVVRIYGTTKVSE